MTLIDDGINALNALTNLLADPGGQVGSHIFLHSRATRARKTTWFKVKTARPLAEQIKEATAKEIRQLLLDARSGHLSEFDFDAMVNGDIGVVRAEDLEALGEWFTSLPPDTTDDAFDGDPELVKRATHYVRRFSFPDGSILTVVSGKSSININAGDRGKIATYFSQQENEMIGVDGPILTIEAKIGFMLWNGLIFIQSLTTFESLTEVREATIQRASQAVKSCGLLFDFTIEADAVAARIAAKPALAKRLAAADKNGYMQGMTGENLNARAVEKQLDIEFIQDPTTGRYKLDIDQDNAQQIQDLVDLLSELFLQSPTTGREYEARVKKPARPRRAAGR
ncbi:hypothetical protein [Xanthomonas axonopodis]|uniref:hypothetical protein n=1 Tax=Xanthomonas axonopodis TaxID=53413 RepID=UPI003556C649